MTRARDRDRRRNADRDGPGAPAAGRDRSASDGDPRVRTDGGTGTGASAGAGAADDGASLGRDLGMVLALMAGIYVLFVGFGVVLGYDLNGMANALQRVTFLVAVYALAVLALNLHWGYTGLFNIGVAGFMAVGAYAYAVLTAAPDAAVPGLGLGFGVGVVGAVVVAALVGGLAALPALRLRADYLAIVTIAFAEIIRYVFRWPALQTVDLGVVTLGTGAARGISPLDPDTAVVSLLVENPVGAALYGPIESVLVDAGVVPNVVRGWVYALFLLAVVAGFYLLLRRVGNSPFGRVLKAIREDEDVAKALGKNTPRFKIKAFMLGCGLMGLVGVLWQASRGFINPTDNFLPQVTFFVWIALIVGGAGSNTGSVLGGALFASLLFEGPRFVVSVVEQTVGLGSAPPTSTAAVGRAVAGDLGAPLAYTLDNVNALRFVLVGVILVLLIQRRPDGLLGHRKETASSIDLSKPVRRGSEGDGPGDPEVAADGGKP